MRRHFHNTDTVTPIGAQLCSRSCCWWTTLLMHFAGISPLASCSTVVTATAWSCCNVLMRTQIDGWRWLSARADAVLSNSLSRHQGADFDCTACCGLTPLVAWHTHSVTWIITRSHPTNRCSDQSRSDFTYGSERLWLRLLMIAYNRSNGSLGSGFSTCNNDKTVRKLLSSFTPAELCLSVS